MDPEIQIREVDTDINNPEFARVVVGALKESLGAKGNGNRSADRSGSEKIERGGL